MPMQIPTIPAFKREMAERDQLRSDCDLMIMLHATVEHSETSTVKIVSIMVPSDQILDSV